MNIFWLDSDLEKCARYHCDKHVVKMLVEYTQLLSASSRLSGVEQGYRLSHAKHPDTLWLLESLENWKLLKILTYHLHEEYKFRYGKEHASYKIAKDLELPNLESKGITIPPQCMPNQYKGSNVIIAYRNYYIGEKARFATWKGRDIPSWFNYDEMFLDEEGNTLDFNEERFLIYEQLKNYAVKLLNLIKLDIKQNGYLNQSMRLYYINEFIKFADVVFESHDKISVYKMKEILKITKEIKLRIY